MIKRFNPDFSLSISHELAYMRETPEGGYVDYRDYASLFSQFEALKASHDALEQRFADVLAENARMKEIIDSVTDLDNEPEYHDCGMGCGLEDRGITDRYEAMRHGWDSAMERVYGEVIPNAEELESEFPATDAALAAVRTQGVEQFIAEMLERGNNPANSLTERVRADMRSAATFARMFIELREAK